MRGEGKNEGRGGESRDGCIGVEGVYAWWDSGKVGENGEV